MRHREPPRVLGPYQKVRLLRELRLPATLITSGLLRDYFDEKEGQGVCTSRTRRDQEPRLVRLLGRYVERPIGSLTPRVATSLYEASVRTPGRRTGKPPSAASHRLDLKIARHFAGWAVERGLLAENPFRSVKPVGKESTGKPQLRLEEARRFISTAMRTFEEYEDRMGLAAAVALMMGMRAGEIVSRRVRDLDDGGRVLWIDAGKTRNARRHLSVPRVLQPHLVRLAAGRGAEEFIFSISSSGAAPQRQTLHKTVWRLCDAARVPRVCPHSLRGLYATLAVESGALSDAVAASLGHSSFAITERHYASAASVHNARTARVENLLESEPSSASADGDRVSVTLDRDVLLQLLALAKNRPPSQSNPPAACSADFVP